MDGTCKFVLKHVPQIFGKHNNPSEETTDNTCQVITKPSYTIRNTYPMPPVTYDGVAANETRCIYRKDLPETGAKLLFSHCGKVDKDDKNDCKCEMKMTGKDLPNLKSVIMSDTCTMNLGKNKKVSEKRQNSSKPEIDRIEQKAIALYNSSDEKKVTEWAQLQNYEKLQFYWRLKDEEFVQKSPFGNFKRFYKMKQIKDDNSPIPEKQMNEKLSIIWYSMTTDQRLPFIMESVIFYLCNGQVNLKDEKQIKCLIKKLKHEI